MSFPTWQNFCLVVSCPASCPALRLVMVGAGVGVGVGLQVGLRLAFAGRVGVCKWGLLVGIGLGCVCCSVLGADGKWIWWG